VPPLPGCKDESPTLIPKMLFDSSGTESSSYQNHDSPQDFYSLKHYTFLRNTKKNHIVLTYTNKIELSFTNEERFPISG